ncbi:uncharacterized protein LOC130719493 [Lotus japonicus]|uniref:uncharacterized protein LOC130719493 n=1 Tax=Lotus japonicus TaxID=34305 RepID=UPI002588AB80|nr:uncharacterized protein LOC130719493 [Lotus japonicus]
MVGNITGDFRPCKNQYKITFKFETKVIPVSVEKVSLNLFKFADFEEILSPSFDQQILADVIGSLTAIELNAFLQAGNISNVVVVLLLAKLMTFQGEIQLQNAFNCSKLLFNPDHPDVYYQRTIFIVLESVEEIVNPDDWSYKACKCNNSVKDNEDRYKLCVSLADDTGSTEFMIFDREGYAIIQKSAKDVEANVVKGG